VVETTEYRPRPDRPRRSDGVWSGGLQPERSVGPIAVVVAEELGQHGAQVPLAEHDEVVETLPAEGADDALRDRVRPRGPDGREQGLEAQRGGALREVAPVDGVAIAEQEARPAAPGGGLWYCPA
jgi:hypothetical protein